MEPSDRSRLVNLSQAMVRAPRIVPRVVEHILSTSPSPDLATAAEALKRGYEEHVEGGKVFDRDAAWELANRLMEAPDDPHREAGGRLADALEVLKP